MEKIKSNNPIQNIEDATSEEEYYKAIEKLVAEVKKSL